MKGKNAWDCLSIASAKIFARLMAARVRDPAYNVNKISKMNTRASVTEQRIKSRSYHYFSQISFWIL